VPGVCGRCSFGGLGCCEVFLGGFRLGVWGVGKCLWEVFVWGFGVLVSVRGRCSFGGLGCCYCRGCVCVCVCVSVLGVLFSVGVCVCV